jgi:hypothetical protein
MSSGDRVHLHAPPINAALPIAGTVVGVAVCVFALLFWSAQFIESGRFVRHALPALLSGGIAVVFGVCLYQSAMHLARAVSVGDSTLTIHYPLGDRRLERADVRCVEVIRRASSEWIMLQRSGDAQPIALSSRVFGRRYPELKRLVTSWVG